MYAQYVNCFKTLMACIMCMCFILLTKTCDERAQQYKTCIFESRVVKGFMRIFYRIVCTVYL